MRIENLAELAQRVAPEGEPGLLPAIEKELVHYHVLQAMSEERLLGEMAFQGGTCLRLCYGSPRYSEDLDFAAGSNFYDLDLMGFSERLARRLGDVFGGAVRVKEPRAHQGSSQVAVARWTVIIRTAPRRDDLPSQRIKVEVASVEALTRELRRVENNYDALPASLSGWLISCESKKEILADKIVSFANTKSHYRRRDLWDIPYLLATTPLDDEVVALVAHKLRDYECQFEACELADRAAERIATVLSDGTLSRELSRFLPRALFDNQLGNGGEHLAAETLRAYSKVVEELVGHESEFENEGVEVRPVIGDLRNGPQAGPQLSRDQEHADPYR